MNYSTLYLFIFYTYYKNHNLMSFRRYCQNYKSKVYNCQIFLDNYELFSTLNVFILYTY